MDERTLLKICGKHLSSADNCLVFGNHEGYCENMSKLLDLLMVELVGGASNETQTKIDNISP